LVSSWRVEQDFVESIRDGTPVRLVSFEDGVRYMEFTDAVWRSWTEGRAVDVPPL
jgi:predicted dehydrogenase